ncbi:MAG: pyridoxamine kinase [Treponema sp.]|nr:pyridoxamine kinase [Treponema sp.]
MKRIVTIQDISCVGKCSLTVALPIISAMGIEASIIPTAVLSTHTAFKNFTFCDLTDQITKISEHWKSEKIQFDGIYTGYLGSFLQIDLMSSFFDDFGKGKLIFVDPCMADNGRLYAGFSEEYVSAMAGLCKKADIIVPNITEACFLVGEQYPDSECDEIFIDNLLKKLALLGAKKIILKGVGYKAGQCGIVTYDVMNCKRSEYFHELVPLKFHGTGDIFASVAFASLILGKSLECAVKLAADFTVQSIKNTVSHTDYNWYGVDFESSFPMLIKKLEE